MVCTPLVSGEEEVVGYVCHAPGVYRRLYQYCPTCQCRRRFVRSYDGAYYGTTDYCCGCGDSWCDGELGFRPFKPRWRQESIAKYKKWWAAALTPKEFDAYVRKDIYDICSPDDEEI